MITPTTRPHPVYSLPVKYQEELRKLTAEVKQQVELELSAQELISEHTGRA
jgi:hypothetical protein